MFKYGEDFFNGDVIQIANEYGHETKARIVEIVMTEDSEGASVYPTFKPIPWHRLPTQPRQFGSELLLIREGSEAIGHRSMSMCD